MKDLTIGGRVVIGLLLVALLPGCQEKPQAPPLVQGLAVYHDEREGYRFAPPKEWLQTRRGNFPAERHEKERMLVQYRCMADGKIGIFRASMIDLPGSVALAEYQSKRPPGPERWRIAGGTEKLQVGQQPAERVTMTGVWKEGKFEEPVSKEVVAVRRGERVYLFTAIFGARDKQMRESARAALESVRWDTTAQ